MKTFVFIQLNPKARPENQKIAIYSVEDNLPKHLVTIRKGYAGVEQAVMMWLTGNNYIPRPGPKESGFDCYMPYGAEEAGHARVREM